MEDDSAEEALAERLAQLAQAMEVGVAYPQRADRG
jgi:hypothetical protein